MGQSMTEELSSEFEEMFFVPNPQTDDLLPDGDHLIEGMSVLIADDKYKIDVAVGKNLERWQLYRALKANRWCTVSGLSVTDVEGTESVAFIGVYEDGTMFQRIYPMHEAWYVKKDSIVEKPAPNLDIIGRRLSKIVGDAMEKQHQWSNHGDIYASEIDLTVVRATAVNQILEVFEGK